MGVEHAKAALDVAVVAMAKPRKYASARDEVNRAVELVTAYDEARDAFEEAVRQDCTNTFKAWCARHLTQEMVIAMALDDVIFNTERE